MPHEIAKQIIRKGTILFSAMSEDKHHLYFICHDPVYIEEYRKDVFLSVNITTIKEGKYFDPACVCSVGDHPFIKNDSYVIYNKAEIFGVDSVISNIKKNFAKISDPCSDELFIRVLEGFNKSERVKNHIKKHFDKYCT